MRTPRVLPVGQVRLQNNLIVRYTRNGSYNVSDYSFDENLTASKLIDISNGTSYKYRTTNIKHKIGFLFRAYCYSVDIYTNSLTLTNSNLGTSNQPNPIQGTNIGNFALFKCGTSRKSMAFDENGTFFVPANLEKTTDHYYGTATHIGNYAIFAGGYSNSNTETKNKVVDVLDRDLNWYHS